jgi:hypothetical protein
MLLDAREPVIVSSGRWGSSSSSIQKSLFTIDFSAKAGEGLTGLPRISDNLTGLETGLSCFVESGADDDPWRERAEIPILQGEATLDFTGELGGALNPRQGK